MISPSNLPGSVDPKYPYAMGEALSFRKRAVSVPPGIISPKKRC